jgi:hypothetical protein
VTFSRRCAAVARIVLGGSEVAAGRGRPRRVQGGTVDEDQVAAEILEYLKERPHAMDTLEGIAEWWLMRQRIRMNVGMLAQVLRRLTERGVLEELGPPNDPRYRLK